MSPNSKFILIFIPFIEAAISSFVNASRSFFSFSTPLLSGVISVLVGIGSSSVSSSSRSKSDSKLNSSSSFTSETVSDSVEGSSVASPSAILISFVVKSSSSSKLTSESKSS